MQNIYKLALALTSKEIGNLIYQPLVQCISTDREGEGHYYSNILTCTGRFDTSRFSRVINTCVIGRFYTRGRIIRPDG